MLGHIRFMAVKLYNKFKCNIYLIEPINEFYNILEQNLVIIVKYHIKI